MKFLRVAFCVLIAFSVLAFGGVEEWAQAGLEVGAAILLVYWAIRFLCAANRSDFCLAIFSAAHGFPACRRDTANLPALPLHPMTRA